MGSLASLIWTCGLLLVIQHVFAVFLTQVVTEKARSYGLEGPKDADDQLELDEMKNNFGSVVRGLYTLYRGISGGMDWGDSVAALSSGVSPAFELLFCVYTAFSQSST